MKKFVSENWYKLMIGSSLVMASFGFMVHSISPVMAQNSNVNSNYKLILTNADGSINVKLSDEQVNKIVPKNTDGSINVRNAPSSTMSINIEEIRGMKAGYTKVGNWVGFDVVPSTCSGTCVHN